MKLKLLMFSQINKIQISYNQIQAANVRIQVGIFCGIKITIYLLTNKIKQQRVENLYKMIN